MRDDRAAGAGSGWALPEIASAMPHLRLDALMGRLIPMFACWDGAKWGVFAPGPRGPIRMDGGSLIDGSYFGTGPYEQVDRSFRFLNTLWQHASFGAISRQAHAIADDLQNLGASILKLCALQAAGARKPMRLATTEIEYILINLRAIFDLLQEIIRGLWRDCTVLLDAEQEKRRKARQLPKSFKDMAFTGDRPKTVDELTTQFPLPESMALCYVRSAEFFSALRTARDRIVHGGNDPGVVFHTEQGWCVLADGEPFRHFEPWMKLIYSENLVSLAPWLQRVISECIATCERLLQAYAEVLQLPPAIAPGMRFFSRGPCIAALGDLLDGGSQWLRDPTTQT